MTVRVPIVDRRSAHAPDSPAPPASPAPHEGLNEAAITGSASQPPAPPASSSGARDATTETPGQADVLAAERNEWRERCLRAAAELENLRRLVDQRVGNEVFRLQKEQLERWLELGDALDRARAQSTNASPEFRAGLEEVARLFEKLMTQAGASRIDAGETFDPALHEAVAAVPDPARPDGAIVDVVRSGWRLGERLLRAVGVVVVRNA